MKECMQHASAKSDIGKDHLPKEEIAERAGMYGLRCSIANLRKSCRLVRTVLMEAKNAVHTLFSQNGHDESRLSSLLEAPRNELLPPQSAKHRRLLNLLVDHVFNGSAVIRISVRS
jgi:hypothetical protein